MDPDDNREELTIEEILESSPEDSFELTEEDKAWLNMPPVGKEVW